MACIYMSGAEWGTMAELSSWYNTCQIATDRVRSGHYSYKIPGRDVWIGVALPGAPQEIFFQSAVQVDRLDVPLLNFYCNYGYTRSGIIIGTPSGQILYYTYNTSTQVWTLRGASESRISVDAWHVFEVHYKADPTFGICNLRIDGRSEIEWAGFTADTATTDIIRWGDGLGPVWNNLDRVGTQWVDDIVINDTSGAVNNSWPGCLKVILLRPNGVGDSTQWIASTEPWNYDNVNDVPVDGTDYVYTPDLGMLDLYQFEDLPLEASNVPVIKSEAWAFKNSGTTVNTRSLEFALQTVAGLTISSPVNLRTDHSLVSYIWDMSATADELNDAQAGIKSTS